MGREDFRQFSRCRGPDAKEVNALIDTNRSLEDGERRKRSISIELLYDAAEALRIIAILISPV